MDWPAPVCVEKGTIMEVRGFEATSFVDFTLIGMREGTFILL